MCLVLGVYRAPPQIFQQQLFDQNMNEFECTIEEYKRIIIFGDFNLNLLNKGESRNISYYFETVIGSGFQFVSSNNSKYCTRIGTTSQTIIDHIITDLFNYIKSVCQILRYLTINKLF